MAEPEPSRTRIRARRFPPLGESVGRRRVFWALVALVVVPTLVLAGYGLNAIKNEADASEARLRERYLLQARALEEAIVSRLAEEDARVQSALARVPDDQLDEALATLGRTSPLLDGAWRGDDPTLPEALRSGDPSPGALSFVAADDGSGRGAFARTTVAPGRVVVYRLAPDALDAIILPQLVGTMFPAEPAHYRLLPSVPTDPAEPVSLDRLRRDLAQGVLAREPEVDRAMAPPFEHWRITITSIEGPSAGSARGYALPVFLLVGLVVLGVTLMGRAMVQQVRLSRLQTDFVSNVSHELRTPLTSIQLFVETLQSGRVTDPAKVDECLSIIAAETDRLSKKIERVLSWARIEAGRRVYTEEALAPISLVEGVLKAFSAQNLTATATVELAVPADLPLVRGDREALEEALLNLLTNARKYGGEGVHIRVSAWAERRYVAIAVADDGPGIPSGERQRIFEKFYRPDLLQSRRSEGSGLGLAIVRAIVIAHKGRVDVETAEGRGAVFTLRLPRVFKARGTVEPPSRAAS